MNTASRRGFSFVELMAVLAVVALVTAIILPRVAGESDAAKAAACNTYLGDIEVQCELWKHNTGSWPAGNLADIGGSANYFPGGLPTCPVDGSAYTISTTTGRVSGHNH